MSKTEFHESFRRLSGRTQMPGLHEGVKDEAYKDGRAAGEAVAKVIQMGWANRPANDSLAAWMKIVDKYVGEEFKEFVNDPQWLKGFQSALVGAFGKAVPLIREAKGFHHGTVRQWKNGRHMKQGGGWERMRSGRSLPLASKMPAVSAASSGSIPAGPYGPSVFEDPSDFSRQAVPTRDMSAAIVNAVAGREVFAVGEALELYAQYLDGETLDEGALAKMKMVFGKLLKVGAKPAPKKPERPQGMSVARREREAIHDYLKRKKASIERGDR